MNDKDKSGRRSTSAIRTRLICPECNAENFVNLKKLGGDEVLCVCGAKIDVSLEKYAGNPPLSGSTERRGHYPRAVGRYKLIKHLGAGGQGSVHLGIDPLGRKVAVKEFKGTAADWEQAFGEARCSMRCSCLNVVNTYDILEDEHTIVQEYVEGETLRRIILTRASDVRKPGATFFPIDQALDLFMGILRGMQVCHFRGVIHLDLKPENVIVESAGGIRIPKISDFGLARNLMEEGERTSRGNVALARSAGDKAFNGTPAYAAPEQIDVKQKHLLSARTDIYQLGIMLFEMLAGRVPFDGNSWEEIFAGILSWTPVKLGELGLEIPKELVEIQERMAARNPQDRYSTIQEALDDLEAWRAGRAVEEYRVAMRIRGRQRGLLILLFGVIGGFLAGLTPLLTQPASESAPRIDEETLVRAGTFVIEEAERATSEITRLNGNIVIAREYMRRAEGQYRILRLLAPESPVVKNLGEMLKEASATVEKGR